MALEAYADGKLLSGLEGHAAKLVINNPKKLNALSLDMWQAGAEAMARYAENIIGSRTRATTSSPRRDRSTANANSNA